MQNQLERTWKLACKLGLYAGYMRNLRRAHVIRIALEEDRTTAV